jgi:hypothetical protein
LLSYYLKFDFSLKISRNVKKTSVSSLDSHDF